MCKWGTEVTLHLKTDASLSHTGETYWRDWPVDACIAPIVKALQDAGIDMLGSCCGHGKADGSILLVDGRELVIRQYEGFPANHFDPDPDLSGDRYNPKR